MRSRRVCADVRTLINSPTCGGCHLFFLFVFSNFFYVECELKLKTVSAACQASFSALENIPSSPSPSEPDFTKIHADFLSLLSLIYHITTKLALALNPTEPTFSAAISPLDDLVVYTNAITSCASLFTTTFGSTLRNEVVGLTLDVLQATKGFIDHCVLITGGATPPLKLKPTHLYLTGSVHELIDHSRGSAGGLSRNNLEAVRKKWSQDRSVLEDGYRELSEILTSGGTDDDPFGDDSDDEHGLVLESPPLTVKEAERAKKVRILISFSCCFELRGAQVQRYLHITNLFHQKVYVDILEPSALELASSFPNFISTLDEISLKSAQFVSATDEIISCLHSPQDPNAISVSLGILGEVLSAIQKLLNQNHFIPKEHSLESQMESVTTGTSKAGKKKAKDIRKWFDTCLDQVDKFKVSLSAEFKG